MLFDAATLALSSNIRPAALASAMRPIASTKSMRTLTPSRLLAGVLLSFPKVEPIVNNHAGQNLWSGKPRAAASRVIEDAVALMKQRLKRSRFWWTRDALSL
jgi:hypothetical protein